MERRKRVEHVVAPAAALILAATADLALPSPWSAVTMFVLAVLLLLWAAWPQWVEEGIEWDHIHPETGFADYPEVVEVRAEGRTIQPVRLRVELTNPPIGKACIIAVHLGSDGSRKQFQGGRGAIVRTKKNAVLINYDTPPLRTGDRLQIHLHKGNLPVKVLRRS